MSEVGMVVQKRYTNKGSWDNKVRYIPTAHYLKCNMYLIIPTTLVCMPFLYCHLYFTHQFVILVTVPVLSLGHTYSAINPNIICLCFIFRRCISQVRSSACVCMYYHVLCAIVCTRESRYINESGKIYTVLMGHISAICTLSVSFIYRVGTTENNTTNEPGTRNYQ